MQVRGRCLGGAAATEGGGEDGGCIDGGVGVEVGSGQGRSNGCQWERRRHQQRRRPGHGEEHPGGEKRVRSEHRDAGRQSALPQSRALGVSMVILIFNATT